MEEKISQITNDVEGKRMYTNKNKNSTVSVQKQQEQSILNLCADIKKRFHKIQRELNFVEESIVLHSSFLDNIFFFNTKIPETIIKEPNIPYLFQKRLRKLNKKVIQIDKESKLYHNNKKKLQKKMENLNQRFERVNHFNKSILSLNTDLISNSESSDDDVINESCKSIVELEQKIEQEKKELEKCIISNNERKNKIKTIKEIIKAQHKINKKKSLSKSYPYPKPNLINFTEKLTSESYIFPSKRKSMTENQRNYILKRFQCIIQKQEEIEQLILKNNDIKKNTQEFFNHKIKKCEKLSKLYQMNKNQISDLKNSIKEYEEANIKSNNKILSLKKQINSFALFQNNRVVFESEKSQIEKQKRTLEKRRKDLLEKQAYLDSKKETLKHQLDEINIQSENIVMLQNNIEKISNETQNIAKKADEMTKIADEETKTMDKEALEASSIFFDSRIGHFQNLLGTQSNLSDSV